MIPALPVSKAVLAALPSSNALWDKTLAGAVLQQSVTVNGYEFPIQDYPLLDDQKADIRDFLVKIGYRGPPLDALYRFDLWPENDRNSAPQARSRTTYYPDNTILSWLIPWEAENDEKVMGIEKAKLQGEDAIHEIGHKLQYALFRRRASKQEEELFAYGLAVQSMPKLCAFEIGGHIAHGELTEDEGLVAGAYFTALGDCGLMFEDFMFGLRKQLQKSAGSRDSKVYLAYLASVAKPLGISGEDLEIKVAEAFKRRTLAGAQAIYQQHI
jgi:hypothetical protein